MAPCRKGIFRDDKSTSSRNPGRGGEPMLASTRLLSRDANDSGSPGWCRYFTSRSLKPTDFRARRAIVWLAEPARVTPMVLPFRSARFLLGESRRTQTDIRAQLPLAATKTRSLPANTAATADEPLKAPNSTEPLTRAWTGTAPRA